MNLTIAYITARKEPRFDWFFASLSKQMDEGDFGPCGLKIIVVDFFKKDRDFTSIPAIVGQECDKLSLKIVSENTTWVDPKPSVWAGPHRLTSVDYWSAASARNTALCMAYDGWLAYVDDASVLMPGWLATVKEALKRENTITLGAYRKVFDLEVKNGLVKSFRDDPLGIDTRNRKARDRITHCDGDWLYGCSFVAPIEALLSINGWDENCDGLGYEDVVTGQLLTNAGWKFVYDPRMLTLESQELHQEPVPMKRIDPGVSPKDKSHAILHSTRMRKWAPNYWGNEELRGFRQRILNGEPFPNRGIPDTDWFTGQKLSEM